MKYIYMTSLFLLVSCTSAQMVSSPNSTSSYGPTNEQSRVGTIKYLNQGADFVIQERREDAYKQMYKACNGKYQIVSESPHSSGGVAQTYGQSTFYSSSEYWYINFQCN